MRIDVYDSYAKPEGKPLMHFDVFVESGTSPEVALGYGKEWLTSIGENHDELKQLRCNFCHSEIADPQVQRTVEIEGFYILQMEGCPVPA